MQPTPPPEVPSGAEVQESSVAWEDVSPAPVLPSIGVQTPVCLKCGQLSVFYPEYDCFWCDACQDYVLSEQTPVYQQAAPPPPHV
ncbi:MAG: hypothetical protein QF682_00790 [Candidatus Thermoplasmatota archaeon]|nr:hypothetical protein [Candidatus Thermoplasmatota archaeon]